MIFLYRFVGFSILAVVLAVVLSWAVITIMEWKHGISRDRCSSQSIKKMVLVNR